LDQSLQNLDNVDSFDFQEFDKNIEKSFQEDFFSSDVIKEYSGQATKQTIKDRFNEWLKEEYKSLDNMKNTEIDNKIVKDTTFELQNFRTLVELEAFQKQIQQQKEETEETEVLTI